MHILGCTSLGKFFSAAFCFLRNETHHDYYWAVSTLLARTGTPQPCVFLSDQEEALKSAIHELLPTVPQLLCIWHINMNVLGNAKEVWREANGVSKEEKEKITQERDQFMARWKQVVYAKTEYDFDQIWQKLLSDYSSQPALCSYLQQNQYQTRTAWAAAWTSQYRHYGTTTTSPIEGMHSVLKRYLGSSQGDLLLVVERIMNMVENQYSQYQKDIASARHTIKFNHKPESMPFLPPGFTILLLQ